LRVSTLSKLLIIALFLTLPFTPLRVNADVTLEEAAKMLPDRVGDFRARGAALMPGAEIFKQHAPEDFGAYSQAARVYVSASGEALGVDLVKTRSDSGAYALLMSGGSSDPQSSQTIRLNDVGTAGIATPSGIAFFKGAAFVRIYSLDKRPGNVEEAIAFARLFAQSLDGGEGEIPVLVKHLPDWETVQERAAYAVSIGGLREAAGNRPALDAINFEGGTEAVSATYGPTRLVLVEYMTPQIASDGDAWINARIKELRDAGQPVPSAYRRVGNYSVFVFDSPDEQTAAQLIDKINYEQVVQWLGNNPRALERAQKLYTQTTAGIILAVLKASGLSLLLCLGVGGIFGAIIFRRRRAQQAATEAYSDAGGMVRLNLDEMTAQSDPARLLGRGNG
jgi:hypothetical protein